VIVSADGMGRELFYVAASRGRDRVTVITSDAEALRVRLSVRAPASPRLSWNASL
jgi:ATP-dependent exoDNAse (exonuclease V) alpha subunit